MPKYEKLSEVWRDTVTGAMVRKTRRTFEPLGVSALVPEDPAAPLPGTLRYTRSAIALVKAQDGSVNYTDAFSVFTVLVGSKDDTTNWTFSALASAGVTAAFGVGADRTRLSVSAATAAGYVRVTASKTGSSSIVFYLPVTLDGSSAAYDMAVAAQAATYNYANNVAPTNNVTELAFTSEANADGSVDIPVSFKYTQGTVPAAGFLVFAKSAVSAPGAIDLASDAAAKFVPASSESGELTYADTLRALSVRFGGAGALLRHYRLAVVAVSQCIGGAIPHNAGVVEVALDPGGHNWTDITFAATIGTSEGDVLLSLEDQALVFRLKSTLAELARLQYDVGTGLLRAGLPSAVPSSGLAVPVFLKGDWAIGTWPAYSELEAVTSTHVTLLALPDGRMLCIYKDITTGYIRQKIRAVNGTWGAYSVVVAAASNHSAAAVSTNGKVLLVYHDAATSTLRYITRDTDGTWGVSKALTSTTADFPVLTGLADGRIYCAYVDTNDSRALRGTIYNFDGTWSAPETIIASSVFYAALATLSTGEIVCVYKGYPSSAYSYELTRSSAGVWGAQTAMPFGTGAAWTTLVAAPDGSLVCQYLNSAKAICQIVKESGTWSSVVTVESTTSYYHALSLMNDGNLMLVYEDYSTHYLRVKVCPCNVGSLTYGHRFLPCGMGVVEHGLDSSGYEYLVLGDGTKLYIDKLLTAGGIKNAMTKKIQRFTSTGTWTCPAGVYSVEVLLVGGGGGGWSSSALGGAGAVIRRRVPVVPGTTYTLTVGAAGISGTTPGVGGTSSFGTLSYAYGGGAASSSTANGTHGTDSAAGRTMSGYSNLYRNCGPCDPKDQMYGGLPETSEANYAYSYQRITGSVPNKGTAGTPGTTTTASSGYGEIEWEE